MNERPPAPDRGLPVYDGQITPDSLRAVVTRALPKISSGTLASLKKATGEIRRLVQAQEALSVESVRRAHLATIGNAVSSIRDGAEPETINNVSDVSTIAAGYSAKRVALREAQGHALIAVLPEIETAGNAIISAVEELSEAAENGERTDAESFGVEFRPSQQLLLFRSVGYLIRRRFKDVHEVITRDPAHAGSPATVFHDILPDATKW